MKRAAAAILLTVCILASVTLSASQIAPAVLPISSSIVIPFPSHNPHRANTHPIFDQMERVRPTPVSQI